MEAAQDSMRRRRVILFYELRLQTMIAKPFGVECLHKQAARITPKMRDDLQTSINPRWVDGAEYILGGHFAVHEGMETRLRLAILVAAPSDSAM